MRDSAQSSSTRRAIGLRELLRLSGDTVPPPSITHYAMGTKRVENHANGTTEITHPSRSAPKTIRDHLQFALKNEALDLRVWHEIMRSLDPDIVRSWISEEPNGKYSRRAWYLYEGLTDSLLDVPDASLTNYVELADSNLQLVLTARAQKSPRHRVLNNLLGTFKFCPLIRNTLQLRQARDSGLKERTQNAIVGIDPNDLRRATDYLYHKESKSSFLIEREDVSLTRMERFVNALRGVNSSRWYDEAELVAVQNSIVDPRYAEEGYRKKQVYIGQTLAWGKERVHYPCPPPEIVESLMDGWRDLLFRTISLDPVCQAAILGFGFVFIHPFEDGNGRLHRFVIHATLVKRHFAPQGVIIPVSATMLRRQERYDSALEAFSKPLLQVIDYKLDEEASMTILSFPDPIYRYWDATPQCEYLYEALAEAVDVDLPEELRVLRTYDTARMAVLAVVDMPDRKADLLTHLLLQNGFHLAKRKRNLFLEISDLELLLIEESVAYAVNHIEGRQSEPANSLTDMLKFSNSHEFSTIRPGNLGINK